MQQANSMVNRLVEEGRIGTIGMIVIDEIQMISDPDRGFQIELFLSKLLFSSANLYVGRCCEISFLLLRRHDRLL